VRAAPLNPFLLIPLELTKTQEVWDRREKEAGVPKLAPGETIQPESISNPQEWLILKLEIKFSFWDQKYKD